MESIKAKAKDKKQSTNEWGFKVHLNGGPENHPEICRSIIMYENY